MVCLTKDELCEYYPCSWKDLDKTETILFPKIKHYILEEYILKIEMCCINLTYCKQVSKKWKNVSFKEESIPIF